MQTVLWWGNYDAEYSRNRIIRKAFAQLGWQASEYKPQKPRFSYLKARLSGLTKPDLVFVPCFCQKDIDAALNFGRHYNVPVMIDPLISLYDTRVFERKTVAKDSLEASRLLALETRTFSAADVVIADTEAHGSYFCETFGVDAKKIQVIPVSAEESVFTTAEVSNDARDLVEVLFYGSFIPLQGVDVIVEAIQLYNGPSVRWCLLGGKNSQSRLNAEQALKGNASVSFEDDIAYGLLPERIRRADILLGVFGSSAKTTRVIPNKVYQSLACGRPVVSCDGPYPAAMRQAQDSGMRWVPPASAKDLADAVAQLATNPEVLLDMRPQARLSYERYFGNDQVRISLLAGLQKIGLSK